MDGTDRVQVTAQRQCLMHPHIIQLREAVVTDDLGLAIIMEYAPGGDLRFTFYLTSSPHSNPLNPCTPLFPPPTFVWAPCVSPLHPAPPGCTPSRAIFLSSTGLCQKMHHLCQVITPTHVIHRFGSIILCCHLALASCAGCH